MGNTAQLQQKAAPPGTVLWGQSLLPIADGKASSVGKLRSHDIGDISAATPLLHPALHHDSYLFPLIEFAESRYLFICFQSVDITKLFC